MTAVLRPARVVARPVRRNLAPVDRFMTHRETRHILRRRPVVIYSMGKTGTTSLSAAVTLATGRPVLKAHGLSSGGIARRMAKAERLGVSRRPRFLWMGEEIARAFRSGGSWDLLCGVRDPIALAVSDHFYGLERQRETGRSPWLVGSPAEHAAAIERNLEENFITRDWFDEELRAVTGLDVYATPFPSSGALALRNDRFRALMLRSENLSEVGPRMLANHLGLREDVPIERRNVGAAAQPDSPYQRFLENGQLPPGVVDRVYASRMARHFYSDTERAALRQRWTGASS